MALEQKLSLKLTQRLVMTPSLQQAIKLLQMTRLELEGVLSQELEENPLLETSDETEEDSEEAPPSEESASADQADGAPGESTADSAEASAEEAVENDPAAMDDIDLDAYFNDYLESGSDYAPSYTYERPEAVPLENTLSREPDLYDHLLWQLHLTELEPLQREIAELVIGNLNADGFLVATIEEIQLLGAAEGEAETYRRDLGAWELATAESTEPTDDDEDARAPADSPADAAEATTPSSRPTAPSAATTAPSAATTAPSVAIAAPSVALAAPSVALAAPSVAMAAPTAATTVPTAATAAPPSRPAVPGYSRKKVEKALELVQSFDPPGVACRDLRESLLGQLATRGDEDSLAYRLIDEEWPRLLKRQFAAIAKSLGVPLQTLQGPAETIRALETRPGRRFSGERAQYVEPDVVVVKVGEEYVIQLNDDGLPRLRVSRAYRRMLKEMRREGRQTDAQQFIKEKMRSAMWLIKSLDQRQRTIYKVADSIVRQQHRFLEKGIDHLRPMVLRDVAEDIGMHESTVSRVVSNKYIHTPRGLYPMKFFFHSGIDRDYGEDISSLSVKRKIQDFISNEDDKKPLSDSELMRRLNREGIKIARRTVAKYRDELRIPSSTDRKAVF